MTDIQEIVEIYLKRIAFEGLYKDSRYADRYRLNKYYSYRNAETVFIGEPALIPNEKLWKFILPNFTEYSKRTVWLSQKETENKEDHISVIRFLWDRMHQLYKDKKYETYSIGTSREAFIFPETPTDILEKCLAYKSGWKRVSTAKKILENVENPGKKLMKQFRKLSTEVGLDTKKFDIYHHSRRYNNIKHKWEKTNTTINQDALNLKNNFQELYKQRRKELKNNDNQ